MSLIEKIAAALEREIDNAPMVLTDPLRLRRLRAERLAQAALTAIMDAGDGVQQCDREAAKSLLGRDDAGPSWWSIDSGNADSDPMVQAFARHRSTAAAAERARRDAEIVAWLRHQDGYGEWQEVADAIERGEV